MKARKKGQSNLSISVPVLRDNLRMYLAELSKYPVLSKVEEDKVVQRMLDGDIEAAKILVTSNLRLVVKIAFEYKPSYQNIMDLIQEGNIGLMKAISMFDPTKGAKLSYYASWWIRSFILKFLIDNFRLVRIGTTQAQKKLFYNLIQEQKRLENQGRLALPEVLSKELDVREKDVIEMTARLSGNAEFSIDQPAFASTYHDNSMRPDIMMEEKDRKQQLKKRLNQIAKTLNEKEKMILKERLLSDAPFTLQQIADNFGISKERARQLQARILRKIKEELADFAL